MKRIVFHLSMIFIGFLGIFLGTLPDLLPDYVPYILFGEHNSMNAGYVRLVNYLKGHKAHDENEIVLGVNDKEYNSIYNLLHSFDPSILPPLQETLLTSKEYGTGNIGFGKGRPEFVTSRTFLLFNQVIYFQDKNNNWRNVCEMRDLYFLVRDAIVRYCSRIGFFFAFISLTVEGISALKKTT